MQVSENNGKSLPATYLFVAMAAWTIAVAILVYWDMGRIWNFTLNQAVNEARANFKKDMAFRYWTATHGGVYVPIDERTPPNPYLKDIFERDISTPSGRKLTLMNPAYIMRQVNEYFFDLYGVGGHLTSIKTLNPHNKPDEWEKKALLAFEQGTKEVYELTEWKGEKVLRFIRPNFVEEGCLKCHGHQGYKVGDVRGGLSITIPMSNYQGFERRETIHHFTVNGILWILGIAGLFLGHRRIRALFHSRLEALDALKGSEETRRLLLDNVAEAILGTDTNGICDFANPACVRMLGFDSADEVVGKNIHNLIHHTHEDGTPFPESECVLNMVISQGKPAHVEREILWRKDGSSFMAAISFHPVYKDGKVTGAVANFIDISDRLMAEKEMARLSMAIEQSGEVVVITDLSAAIQYVNRAFEETTGYTRAEVMGQNPRMLQSGRHDQEFYKNLWATISSGLTWKGTFVNKKKDGTLYEEGAVISPVTGEGGAIISYVAVKRDVTRESMLRQARDYFTLVTSHELRTPLTKLGLAKLLLEQGASSGKLDDTTLRASMEALEASMGGFQNVVTAGEMFNDLALSNKALHFREAPLTPMLVYAVELFKKKMAEEKRDLEISLEIDSTEGEYMIPCDQSKIQYALNEVLSNAAKYSPDGKKVTVMARRVGQLANITIKDEGIGLPRSRKESAFDPIFSLETVDRHSTGKYSYLGGGIGMGLTLARLIAQAHGGGLSLESEGEGLGASVVIALPLARGRGTVR